MTASRLAILIVVLSLWTSPGIAQSGGTLELGAFGRYTVFDDVFPFDDNLGGGLWLGVFVKPWLSLEGDASITMTRGTPNLDITYLPFRARLLFQPALSDRFALMAGAGFVHSVYGSDVDGADNGATGLLGIRWAVTSALMMRLEGLLDFVPTAASGGQTAWNTGVQVGLSYLVSPVFGEAMARPMDSDGDGIADRDDRCPGTSPGALVDGRGCRLAVDADGDGVNDSEDACPDTPAGAQVDSRGCPVPRDGDGDGVEDASDACPGTPTGAQVDARGCPVPRDGDGDGVEDAGDACPDTPTGAQVDARGCPVPRDGDGDGVEDASDACPGTPAGAQVDARGCPVPERDADADGVPDTEDACQNTPSGVEVDLRGCARILDGDRDGVIDAEDECPETPAGTRVDERGCPQPVDADGDGVVDAVDACPGTAAGTAVDSNGCPLESGDEDADGVPNAADACPGTAAGVAVDARGCWRLFEGGASRVVLEGVSFQSDTTYELTEQARGILDRVAAWLQANPSVNVEIGAHTDNTGFRPYALIRSLGQASAVRRYLISQGVSGSRLQAKGYGPDQPLTSNATPDGRARNRRVELRRLN